MNEYNINMRLLEYYTSDFDSRENIVDGGLSDKVFLSDTELKEGKELMDLKDALLDVDSIDGLIIYYQKNGVQYFKKFFNNAP